MANFDPSLYDPARAVTVNRNGTLVPGSGDRFNGMIRAGDGVPEAELGRVPNGHGPLVLSVPAGAPRGFYDPPPPVRAALQLRVDADGRRPDRRFAAASGCSTTARRATSSSAAAATARSTARRTSSAPSTRTATCHRRAAARSPRRRRSGHLAAIDPDLQVPRAWNWSLSVQRELPWGFFGEVGYVGSDGQNLLRQPDINQPSFEALEAPTPRCRPRSARTRTSCVRTRATRRSRCASPTPTRATTPCSSS